MTLSVAEITTRITRQFGDEANSQISQEDIIRWINDAMREIAHKNKLLQAKAVTDVLSQIRTYTLPTDMSKLHSVRYKGVTLTPVTVAEADELLGQLDVTVTDGFPVGTPTHYWIWADQINLYPAPDTNVTGGLTAYYSRVPVPVANPGDVPELTDEYHNRILDYCLAQAFEIDENYQVSQAKMQAFNQGVAASNNISEEQQETYPYITSSYDETDFYPYYYA